MGRGGLTALQARPATLLRHAADRQLSRARQSRGSRSQVFGPWFGLLWATERGAQCAQCWWSQSYGLLASPSYILRSRPFLWRLSALNLNMAAPCRDVSGLLVVVNTPLLGLRKVCLASDAYQSRPRIFGYPRHMPELLVRTAHQARLEPRAALLLSLLQRPISSDLSCNSSVSPFHSYLALLLHHGRRQAGRARRGREGSSEQDGDLRGASRAGRTAQEPCAHHCHGRVWVREVERWSGPGCKGALALLSLWHPSGSGKLRRQVATGEADRAEQGSSSSSGRKRLTSAFHIHSLLMHTYTDRRACHCSPPRSVHGCMTSVPDPVR